MFSHHGAGCCCHAGILDSQVIAETKKHYVGENSQLCPSYSRGSHQIRFCLKLVRSWAIRSNFPQIAGTSKHCNEQHSDTQVPAINVAFKTAQFVSLLDRNPYIFLSFLIIWVKSTHINKSAQNLMEDWEFPYLDTRYSIPIISRWSQYIATLFLVIPVLQGGGCISTDLNWRMTKGIFLCQRKHQNLTQSSSLYLEDKTPPGPYSNACRLLELTGERFRAASRYGKPMGNREKWLVYCWIKGWVTLSGSESELKAWHTSLLPDVGANKPCSEKPCRSGLFARRLILNSWHNGKARNLTSCQHSSMFTHAYMEEALRVLPNKIVKMLWKWGEVPEVGPFNKTLLLLVD